MTTATPKKLYIHRAFCDRVICNTATRDKRYWSIHCAQAVAKIMRVFQPTVIAANAHYDAKTKTKAN